MPKVSVYRGRNHLFDHWIEKDSVVIGRSADADIPLDSPAASRQHCRIVRKQGVYVLEEMGAKNGLFVNGQYCNVKRLRNGDSIEIADHVLLFRRTREEAEAEKDAGNAYRIGAQAIDQAMTVRKGDSLGVIAQRNGCSVSDLRSWNNLTSSRIYPGQKLKIRS